MNTKFESLITCDGYIVEETNDKIRFVQEYNDCMINKKMIKRIERIGTTNERTIHCLITLEESFADDLQLKGILE
jgi:hypothetical protein